MKTSLSLSLMEIIVSILVSLLTFQPVGVNALVAYVKHGITLGSSNFTKGSIYENNLNIVFSNLSSQTSNVKFYNFTHGDVHNKVYALFQCREDLSSEVCSACLREATRKIVQNLPPYVEGAVWYYECIVLHNVLQT